MSLIDPFIIVVLLQVAIVIGVLIFPDLAMFGFLLSCYMWIVVSVWGAEAIMFDLKVLTGIFVLFYGGLGFLVLISTWGPKIREVGSSYISA